MKVVIVDDHESTISGLKSIIKEVKGLEITGQATNGIEALKLVKTGNPDMIISDILMPGLTGLEILEDLHECKGFPPMILITAFGDENVHRKAKRLGAAAMFDKPFEIDDLLSKVREIVPPHTA